MKPEALQRAFADYSDRTLWSLCHQIADDPQLLALAAHARPGSFMPYFFLTCVRYLFLKERAHPLGPKLVSPGSEQLTADEYQVFRQYCLGHAARLKKLLATGRTQTNDVLRSAVLFPAFCLAAQRSAGAGLGLVEVGTSAGLNLCWDQYRHDYDGLGSFGALGSSVRLRLGWRGAPPAHDLSKVPKVATRIGIDLDPIDLEDEDEVLWLRSFLGGAGSLPEAIELARRTPRQLIRGDALDHLEAAVRGLPEHVVATVFHSFCTYQFTDAALRRFDALIAQLGDERPLHWIRLEGQALELSSFRPRQAPRSDLLAVTDVPGGVYEWLSWSYAGRT